MQKIIFIIPSVLHFKEAPLSYISTRSIFTVEERLSQTKQTITSIRDKVPSAHIVLAEMGTETAPPDLQSLVDTYKYLGNKKIVRFACDGKYKGLGEAIGLLYILPVVKKIEGDSIFKISGRYSLNDHFSLDEWDMGDKCTFLKSKGLFSTRLYRIPKKLLSVWKYALLKSLPFLLRNESIESTLTRCMPQKYISIISVAGISGVVAPTGDIIEE